jgi:hypothetical protein
MGTPSAYLAGILMLLGAGPPSAGASPVKAEAVVLRGKVMPLGTALHSLGLDLKPDPESIAHQMVLLGEDRSITPLLSDDASRALFLDERLRGCRTEIRGLRFPGVPYLQVLTFRIEREGRLQTPEYYCSICAISAPFPQTCPCCQGPMELRMKPERR